MYRFITEEENEYNMNLEQLQEKYKKLKVVLNKVRKEIEEKIEFCESEAEGHINHEKCDKTILFLRGLLEDLKEVE